MVVKTSDDALYLPQEKRIVESDVDRRTLFMVSAGHFIVDMCQGTVPVMLPLLMIRMNLDYAQAGLVVTAAYLTSSITQPLFGLIRNQRIRYGAVPIGVLLACSLLAIAGQLHSYPLLLLAVMISSAGVAMFHPEAAAMANNASGTVNKSKGMSVFAMCGSVGFTFGPLVFGPVLAGVGLRGVLFLLLPALVMPLLLLRFTHSPVVAPKSDLVGRKSCERHSTTPGFSLASPMVAMGLIVAVVAFARWAMAGTMTFLPLYFEHYLGLSPAIGNRAMIAFQVGGDVGTLASGFLVGRFGTKRVLIAGLIFATPLLIGFYHVTGVATLALLFLANFMLAMTVLSTTLMGQEYLPDRKALAASLTLGLGVGLGGLGSGLLGHVADSRGIQTALLLVGITPILGAVIATMLPHLQVKKAS